jgi:hypothetical protein
LPVAVLPLLAGASVLGAIFVSVRLPGLLA